MAQKRMFDKAIIETDNFLNVSLSAKALYFLLGMEADDEGFVSPNRVMRLYGAEIGDLKNLIDTGLIIRFKSGVVVITDWRQNNWLDIRRIKQTQYQDERKQLQLLVNNKYLLSGCLAVAEPEESSIEESSIEESSIVTATPSEVVNYFFELKSWGNKDESFYKEKKIIYSRFVKPAKELLVLCDDNLDEAKECLKKVADWAISRNLDWSIETVFKKWYDLDLLKPKEKKPYFDGKRIFQKFVNGKWWCVSKDGEIRELGLIPKKEEIIYK